MGGKSTFLRQNALIAVMAQMGVYVPANYATLGVVDQLFSRVCDERSYMQRFLVVSPTNTI